MRFASWQTVGVALIGSALLVSCSWLPKFSFQSKPKDLDVVASADQNVPLSSGQGSTLKNAEGKSVGTGYGDCVNLGHSVAEGEVSGDCDGALQVTTPDTGMAGSKGDMAGGDAGAQRARVEEAPTAQPSAPKPSMEAPAAATVTPVKPAPSATVREVEPQVPGRSQDYATPGESGAKAPPVVGTEIAPAMEKVSLQGDVLFAFGKADLGSLTPAGKAKLDELAAHIMTYDPATVQRINVVGHADRLGKAKANQRLSERRASTLKTYLIQRGVAADKIHSSGRGSTQPVVQCKGKKKTPKLVACLQPNRRVEVQIQGMKKPA